MQSASKQRAVVFTEFAAADLQRIDAAVARRNYGRTRSAFVREIVLAELDRLDRQQNGLPNTAGAAPAASTPARPTANARRAGR